MTETPILPPFFSIPREIRNRIYFWVIAQHFHPTRQDYTSRARTQITKPADQKRLCFSPRIPGHHDHDISRAGVAAAALSSRDVQALISTSEAVMHEFLAELEIASGLPLRQARQTPRPAAAPTSEPYPETESQPNPKSPPKPTELNIYGIGAPGTAHLTPFNIHLIEIFLSRFMPSVPHVVVHTQSSGVQRTFADVVEHFKAHGAGRMRRDEMRGKAAPGTLKMEIRGIHRKRTNWFGQTTVLKGGLNDFLRGELEVGPPTVEGLA